MQDFLKFKEFVKRINSSNGRTHKMYVLSYYEDDTAIRFYLKFIFDPYIVTGLSKKKLAKDISPCRTAVAQSSMTLLNWISKNNTGTDEAISYVKAFEQNLKPDEVELFERVICKNLPMGIDTLSINKVMPGLIPTFDVMLANKYFEKPEVVQGKDFTLTTKIDGGRIIALKKDNVVKFYTRAGQEYEGLVDLEKEMLESLPDNIALDGEITLLDTEGLDNKAQYKQTMMITRRLGEKHGIKMKVFDIMSADEFISKSCSTPYIVRRATLDDLAKQRQLTFFEVLSILYQGNDCTMIAQVLEEQIAHGEEGVMVNINDEPYCFGRGNALLKVKKMQDVDLQIVGLEEGTNQNASSLGAFRVAYKGNEVRVGSGISKELRKEIWANPDEYIGRTIIVQYFEETTNQAGKVSLRFPVFVDFRYDK